LTNGTNATANENLNVTGETLKNETNAGEAEDLNNNSTLNKTEL